jgi:hypothetical protein
LSIYRDSLNRYFVFASGNSDDPAFPLGTASWAVYNNSNGVILAGSGEGSFGPLNINNINSVGDMACQTSRRVDYGVDCLGNPQFLGDSISFTKDNIGAGNYSCPH